MSKTIRYNPDSFHKDARESNINHRKLHREDKTFNYAKLYGTEPRVADRILQEEFQHDQAEDDKEGGD